MAHQTVDQPNPTTPRDSYGSGVPHTLPTAGFIMSRSRKLRCDDRIGYHI